MTVYEVLLYVFVGLYGLVIGSFLNVCIFRIPKGEGVVLKRSHCMNCGYELQWYDLIPLFSYIGLRGRCRKCKQHISLQYPLIEALNALLYVAVFLADSFTWQAVLDAFFVSALIVVSVIDFRTMKIPIPLIQFIGVLGIINIALNYRHWYQYIIGFLVIYLPLYLIWRLSDGKWIGGGDVMLMGACALILGYKLVILSFFAACIIGSVVHLVRMKFFGEGRTLALGPYLAIGMILVLLFGQRFLQWYCGGIFA